MKHSDTKQTFTTGAQRDSQDAKPRPDLISPFALERVGWVCKRGADHYGDRNWEKGMPLSRVSASLFRHLLAYLQGDESEDHAAQLAWNAMALLHFDEGIKRGFLPATLDDLPHYLAGKAAPATGDFEYDEARKLSDTIALGSDGKAGTMTRAKDRPERYYLDHENLYTLAGDPLRTQILGGISYTERSRGNGRYMAYVAGPMRGIAQFNFPAFDAARDQLLSLGWDVISPADIDRAAKDESSDNQALFCLRDFFSIFYIAQECGDRAGLVVLPGWEKSKGAVAEVMIARWLGVKIYDATTGFELRYENVRTKHLTNALRNYLGNN